MTTSAPHRHAMDPASTAASLAHDEGVDTNAAPDCVAVYRRLTGGAPDAARIEDDHSFDRHVLASILALASTEGGPLTERSGLPASDLARLLAQWFPSAGGDPAACQAKKQPCHAIPPEDEEVAMVRDLLLTQRSTTSDAGRWLAAMLARRAMEPNHLWEDLGLRERAELTRLITRHFAPLAARNDRNMRWKRFFYRMLCEDDGFVMCSTPVCTQCGDFDTCFGDESGESRMADRRRALSLAAPPSAGPDATSSHPSQ